MPIEPSLWTVYQTERRARRAQAREQLAGHQVLDVEDWYDVLASRGANARGNRLLLAHAFRAARGRGDTTAEIARRSGFTEDDVSRLMDGPIIAGEELARAIDAELAERFKEDPESERRRTMVQPGYSGDRRWNEERELRERVLGQ